jgi:hypothetical protein
MCIIFNVLILFAYAGEMWFDYGIILDEDVQLNEKKFYIIRIVIISVLAFIAIMLLYKKFGVNDSNLVYYIKFGKIR